MNRLSKVWRESTTIIPVIQRTASSKLNRNETCNYDILVQQRSENTAFLPSSIVFPGGMYEIKDSSPEWITYLKSFNIPNYKFDVFYNLEGWDTPIFQGSNMKENRHISLRICAIRETFEELGILICKHKGEEANKSTWAKPITDFDIPSWQKKVHNDPAEFLNLCQTLKCYPDIWSLYYWSEWLTPLGVYNVRYDTAFFMVFLQSMPHVLREKTEVSDVLLSSPDAILNKFYKNELFLPPPQFYELLRLKDQTFEKLATFASNRNPQQPELMYPVICNTKDGYLAILPGDDFYPKKLNLIDQEDMADDVALNFKNKTVDQLSAETEVLHRFEFADRQQIRVQNYVPKGNPFVPSNYVN